MGHKHIKDYKEVWSVPLSKARIEALCDGIFAIVMTLLILELHVPDKTLPYARPLLGVHLLALWPKFLCYINTFLVAGIYWIGHHMQFHFIRRADRVLLWLNLFFLLSVSVLPFSAAILGDYPTSQLAIMVYGCHLIFTGLLLYVQWSYATGGLRLVDPDMDWRVVTSARPKFLIAPTGCLIAIGWSFYNTQISLICYSLIIVFYVLLSGSDAVQRRAPEIASSEAVTHAESHPVSSDRDTH